jgi:hypothetical protein
VATHCCECLACNGDGVEWRRVDTGVRSHGGGTSLQGRSKIGVSVVLVDVDVILRLGIGLWVLRMWYNTIM